MLPAALATSAVLCILMALGIWQLHRRAWKQAMLDAIDRAENSPALPLHGIPAPFSKLSVRGTLLPRKALYGVAVRDVLGGRQQEGAHLVGILVRADGLPVVVDLGWVPAGDGAPDPLARNGGSDGVITITGYARAPDHAGLLSMNDDVGERRFYTLDPARIGAVLGEPDVAPFTLVAMGRPGAQGSPVPADALPRPPNNHLQYAFTWFGLAGTLVWVFGGWVRKEGRAMADGLSSPDMPSSD